MYEMIYGEFDLALDVCHTCDHPACYNPRHLFLGTHKDNMLDRNRKGRNILPPIRFGDKSNLAKLTAQQVEEIRATPYFVIPRAELAKKYGVSKNHITRLKHGYGRKES